MKFVKELKQRFSDADNVIDFSVDMALLLFDVLTTPLLIPIRIAKYYIKKAFRTFIKSNLKWLYHRVYDKKTKPVEASGEPFKGSDDS
tara:strand:- start:213 stop:476 length:264 start_codon:yes stop_codon:yes gene_type:complete